MLRVLFQSPHPEHLLRDAFGNDAHGFAGARSLSRPNKTSQLKVSSTQDNNQLSLVLLFWLKTVLKNKCKEFSRIVCVSLFSYQGCLSCDSLFNLSHLFFFVKHFFKFFKVFRTLSFSRNVPQMYDCRLCSSDLLTLTYPFQVVKHFFKFLFYFRNLFKLSLFKKQLFPTAHLIYHQKSTMSTVNFII